MRYLTTSEVDRVLFILKDKSILWHDIVIFALNTGMRAGEIFSLRPYDIDFNQRVAKLYDTKNKNTRAVPLNDKALDIVNKYYDKFADTLFVSDQGNKLSQTRPFSRAVEEAGLNDGITDIRERVCFHSLRHTFASWLVQAGVPLSVVGQLLGHKQPRMTMRYAHLSNQQEVDAVTILEKIQDGSKQT